MAIDAASGEERWTPPGIPSYAVPLAVGDGLVVVKMPARPELVAYELSSGDERWRATLTTAGDPQMIVGTSFVMLWEGELAVRSTTDGAVRWSAKEPFGTSWMNSVGSNGDSIFVAMNSLPWND